MNRDKLRTVLVGFGKISQKYAQDSVMSARVCYATHAQVLRDHPDFMWEAVADSSREALEAARSQWDIRIVARSSEEMAKQYEPEVAVIATPPDSRLAIVKQFSKLRAVLVEKPLGRNLSEARRLLDYCDAHGIKVQVNLLRRANEMFRKLSDGQLAEMIGQPQAVFGVYGNGLRNNGTHMIDLIRMLFGEINHVRAICGRQSYPAGPIPDDINVPYSLYLNSGLVVMMQPVRFEYYRENSLDIWGQKARLCVMQGGLEVYLYPKHPHRAMQSETEINMDKPQKLDWSVKSPFYLMYSNLADALSGKAELLSPGKSAYLTECVVEAVIHSARSNDTLVKLDLPPACKKSSISDS